MSLFAFSEDFLDIVLYFSMPLARTLRQTLSYTLKSWHVEKVTSASKFGLVVFHEQFIRIIVGPKIYKFKIIYIQTYTFY